VFQIAARKTDREITMIARCIAPQATRFAAVVFSLVFFCLSFSCLELQGQTIITPAWMKWQGDGTSSFSCLSGTCPLTGENWYTNFTVAAGATVTNPSGNSALVIRASGTCTVNGTISNSPNSGSFGISGNGDFGGGGGGGGGGTGSGTWGETTQVILNIPLVNGGIGGNSSGGAGGNGKSTTINQYQEFLSVSSDWPGGGGAGGQGGSNGAVGGNGGGPVILVCDIIDFTGTIDASGGPGGNATANNTGAGGGGGGGYVVLAAPTFTVKTGTILVNGGPGGSCGGFTNCGAGGPGGTGWSYSMTVE
jgi:hypothetical protein